MQYTRPHEAYPSPQMTNGSNPSSSAVLLSYFKLPEVRAQNCLTVETSWQSQGECAEEIVDMYPNPAGYLCDSSWNHEHQALWAEITSVFSGDEPLFYLHVCKHLTPNASTAGIKLFLSDGRPWPADRRYLIELKQEGALYRPYIYTNFLRDDEYSVSYLAALPHGVGEHAEPLYPLPLSLPVADDDRFAGNRYRIQPGSLWNTIRIAVDDEVVRDIRTPVFFRYTIRAEVIRQDGSREEYWAPKRLGVVYNQDSLLESERTEYPRGRKILDQRKVAEIMRDILQDKVASGERVIVRYEAVTDNSFVSAGCRPDGEGPVYASTAVDTGRPPALVDAPGRQWQCVEYTAANLQQLGFKGSERRIEAVVTIFSGDTVYSQRAYEFFAELGFTKKEIAIRVEDFPDIPPNAVLGVSLANNPPGLDVQLVVGGIERAGAGGEPEAAWETVKNCGGAQIVVTEIYRPRCFVRKYVTRLVKSIPIELAAPDAGNDEPWRIRVRNGMVVRVLPDEHYRLVYDFCNRPRYKMTTEPSPVFISTDTIRLRNTPLLVGPGRDGRPVNISVSAGGRMVDVVWCDTLSGLIKLAEPLSANSDINVSYWHRNDWLEYVGYSEEERFYPLDLNPATGAVGFEQKTYQPSLFIGRNIYLSLLPSCLISNVRYVHQEELRPQKITRRGRAIVWIVRTKYPPLPGMPVEVCRGDTLEPVPYKSGETRWEYQQQEEGEIAIYNPSIPLDPLGRPEAPYLISYYYVDDRWHIVETYQEAGAVVHSMEEPQDDTVLTIGRVCLDPGIDPGDAAVIDIRSRGGGVHEDLLDRAYEIEPESRHYFDIGYWEGEPWQGNGVVLVYLPQEVKERGWSADFVRQLVERHRAAGVLPLVDYWKGDDIYPGRPDHVNLEFVDAPGIEDRLTTPRHLTLETVFQS